MPPQKFQPSVCESFPRLSCLGPHPLEVALIAHIFSDRNSVIKVDHGVPPSSGNEHGLAWVLDALDDRRQFALRMVLGCLQAWENKVEVLDGFIILALLHQMAASHESLC